jgi:hypothetical protein
MQKVIPWAQLKWSELIGSGQPQGQSSTTLLRILREDQDITDPFLVKLSDGRSFTVTDKVSDGTHGGIYKGLSTAVHSTAAIILKVYHHDDNPKTHWTSFYRELRALRIIDSFSHEENRLLGFDRRNLIIIQRQIPGIPFDKHLASVLDQPMKSLGFGHSSRVSRPTSIPSTVSFTVKSLHPTSFTTHHLTR